MLPSLKVPVAVNEIFVPWAIVGLPGVMLNDLRLAAFTFMVTLPVTPVSVAEIVVLPILSAVARPLTVIEAMLEDEDFQATTPVMSCLDESEKVPIAVNCCASPIGISGFDVVTSMEVTVAEVTVRVVDPVIDPEVAVMEVVPAVSAFAKHCVGLELLIVATAVFEDAQVTLPVMFCLLPSL